jgi:hypothetical protein
MVLSCCRKRTPRLFGISHGQSIGLPNLLGVWRKEPEQVRESDTSTIQTPRDPTPNKWLNNSNFRHLHFLALHKGQGVPSSAFEGKGR